MNNSELVGRIAAALVKGDMYERVSTTSQGHVRSLQGLLTTLYDLVLFSISHSLLLLLLIYLFIGRRKKHPTGHAGPSTEHLHVTNIANKETEQSATRPMAP